MSNLTSCATAHKVHFEQSILPIVERHARVAFRGLRHRPDDLAEAIADAAAHAWEGYISAIRAGKSDQVYPTVLATFAARKTAVGRKVGKPMNAKDVFNAAWSQRACLSHLDEQDGWQSALRDNTQTAVDEQAAFRCDFPQWLDQLPTRDRAIAEAFLDGARPSDIAQRFGISQARVTQIRQQLASDWAVFTA